MLARCKRDPGKPVTQANCRLEGARPLHKRTLFEFPEIYEEKMRQFLENCGKSLAAACQIGRIARPCGHSPSVYTKSMAATSTAEDLRPISLALPTG